MRVFRILALALLPSLALSAFGQPKDTRPHLVILSAEDEYKTEQTLPAFAKAELDAAFRVTVLVADPKDRTRIPGIEALDTADALFLSVRRRPLSESDLGRIRKFLAAGKPLIAIRTSSHAFAVRGGEKLPEGGSEWKEFDREILGGNYTGHYPEAKKTTVQIVADVKHPILTGVKPEPFAVGSSLYKTSPLGAGTTILARGSIEGQPSEPVAWVRERPGGGRVFYCSLGHIDDFKEANAVKLLRNGVYWAMGKDVPK